MIRVAIIEDDPAVQDSVAYLLEATEDMVLVSQFTTGKEALQGLPEQEVDIVLVDIGLPDVSGIEVIRALSPRMRQLKFLVLTVFEDTTTILQAILAGAMGYLVKRDLPEYLLQAVRILQEGGSWMSPDVATRVLHFLKETHGSGSPEATLTPREWEILELLAQGYTNQQIAESLFVSLNTVRTHIRHIYRKLQVRNRAEAVSWYYRNIILLGD